MYAVIVLKDPIDGTYPSNEEIETNRHKMVTLTYNRKASIIHAVKRSKIVHNTDYMIYFYDTNESTQVLDIYYSALADSPRYKRIVTEVPSLDITK